MFVPIIPKLKKGEEIVHHPYHSSLFPFILRFIYNSWRIFYYFQLFSNFLTNEKNLFCVCERVSLKPNVLTIFNFLPDRCIKIKNLLFFLFFRLKYFPHPSKSLQVLPSTVHLLISKINGLYTFSLSQS